MSKKPVSKFTRLLETRSETFLTHKLYDLLYIHSNLFIAHFDRLGFFEARIKDPDGFTTTLALLASARFKPKTSPENQQVNALIQDARDFKFKHYL